jgi:nitrite reductase (NADH) small subunit
MGKFVKVAKKSEIPSDHGLCVQAGGREIALFNVGGKVYAIDQICPHAGGPLAEGAVHGDQVMCPWHGWEFNVKTGTCAFNAAIKQDVFKVKEDGDDVYVES